MNTSEYKLKRSFLKKWKKLIILLPISIILNLMRRTFKVLQLNLGVGVLYKRLVIYVTYNGKTL